MVERSMLLFHQSHAHLVQFLLSKMVNNDEHSSNYLFCSISSFIQNRTLKRSEEDAEEEVEEEIAAVAAAVTVGADVVVVETVQHEVVVTRNAAPVPIRLPYIVFHVKDFADLQNNPRRLSPAAMAGECISRFIIYNSMNLNEMIILCFF